MTYQIINVETGKAIKNAIDRKVMTFETLDHAETFAASMTANSRVDSARNGRRMQRFTVRESAHACPHCGTNGEHYCPADVATA